MGDITCINPPSAHRHTHQTFTDTRHSQTPGIHRHQAFTDKVGRKDKTENMMEEEQNNDHVTIHQTEKQGYLNYTTSDEGFKGTNVNRTFHS